MYALDLGSINCYFCKIFMEKNITCISNFLIVAIPCTEMLYSVISCIYCDYIIDIQSVLEFANIIYIHIFAQIIHARRSNLNNKIINKIIHKLSNLIFYFQSFFQRYRLENSLLK